MPPDPGTPPPIFDWLIATIIAGFSFVGGLIGSAMRTAEQRNTFKLFVWLLEGAAAAFVSVVVMLICLAWGVRYEIIGAACGVVGLMGAKTALRLLQAITLKKWNITSTDVQAAKDLEDPKNVP